MPILGVFWDPKACPMFIAEFVLNFAAFKVFSIFEAPVVGDDDSIFLLYSKGELVAIFVFENILFVIGLAFWQHNV